jgi:hypothetical protein
MAIPGMGAIVKAAAPTAIDAAKQGAAAPVSMATGALQSLQAMRLKKKAEGSMPGEVDSRQAAHLSELAQKRKSIDTGADFAAGMQAVDTGQAGTNAAIVKATGGDVGGTVQALLQAQRGADTAKGNVLAQGQQQRMGYDSMYGDLMNKISARQLQLQMYKSQQARAEWAQKKQTSSQNMMAGIAGALTPGAGKGPASSGAPATSTAMPFSMNTTPTGLGINQQGAELAATADNQQNTFGTPNTDTSKMKVNNLLAMNQSKKDTFGTPGGGAFADISPLNVFKK